MSNASTRAHVASTEATPQSLIPAVDLDLEIRQTSTPEDSDNDSDASTGFTTKKTRKQLRKQKAKDKRAQALNDLFAAVSQLAISLQDTNGIPIETHQSTFPQSRKEKRKQKKTKHDSALPTPSGTDSETPPTPPRKTPPNNASQKANPNPSSSALAMAKPALQKSYPLLVASIGNPGATYSNTLHSAGHIVTSALSTAKSYAPFTKGLSGQVSRPPPTHLAFSFTGFRHVPTEHDATQDWTFWQSTSLMNVSGTGVKKAYNEWLRGIRQASGSNTLEGRLVVVHDELESALGKITIRDGGVSAKGHNGIKSCQQQLGGIKWWRVGVGIGRPESRDPNVVSKYVLGKMTSFQRGALEKCTVPVYKALEEIAEGKR
ncbi:Peptidyl-tRNA hydrolase [Pyrenophora tritici-repentis]|uniref:peptidyl-tRNA hydrolase n=1 Tax=Pyrenophora tritici-repentis TaxID=45151 RepID=A0A317AF35_9PLEO|nr:Peptidyl-tRNA hydrolase [Pyrenophora tritici-repentis]KAF7577182.1 Pth, Peptidyl-tRNA hydrolase [Pyrenophora tritici-repentis]